MADINIKQRYHYIDYIRVYSILMVILLHCICDYLNNDANFGKGLWYTLGFTNELCRTGVPLFFMISGFLLLNKDIGDVKSFYRHRFLKIAIPFIAYDIFYFIYFAIDSGNEISLLRFVKELVNNGSAYHLWFMYSILFLYIMAPFVRMIVEKCTFNMILMFLGIVIFQTTLKPFVNILLNGRAYVYLTEDGIVGYLGFMILGYILGRYDTSKTARGIIYGAGIASFILFTLANVHFAKVGRGFVFNGGYTINHYIEAAAIFVFCKNNINVKSKIAHSLSSATMDAYFIHVFVLHLLAKINWNVRPVYLIGCTASVAVVVSFGWAYLKKYTVDLFSIGRRLIYS